MSRGGPELVPSKCVPLVNRVVDFTLRVIDGIARKLGRFVYITLHLPDMILDFRTVGLNLPFRAVA